MIHISSYHSNGLQPVVWPNKVNLIGEKVYKPKIHFCEHCNKPILIYGRLIPCKHVFCFSCSTLCLTQQQINANNANNLAMVSTPPPPGPTEPPSVSIQSPSTFHHQHQSSPINNNTSNDKYQRHSTRGSSGGGATTNSSSSNTRMMDLHRSDSNSLMNIDESTSNTTPTTIQLDTISSPNQNNSLNGQQKANIIASAGKGCHRCGNRALRVERNTLNSIFVCQVETCRRTYLSARDLQAHVTHRHSKNKAHNNGTSTASMAAISSSPYITSSSLLHLNHNNQSGTSQRQSSSSTSTTNNTSSNPNHSNNNSNNNNNSPNNHHPRRGERGEPSHYSHHHHNHHNNHHNARDRDNRDRYNNRDRESYARDRDRERDSKEYHRQSIQRAAQWAEASAQMLEKGLTR